MYLWPPPIHLTLTPNKPHLFQWMCLFHIFSQLSPVSLGLPLYQARGAWPRSTSLRCAASLQQEMMYSRLSMVDERG